jgi:multidrug efflux system outer membrane protein
MKNILISILCYSLISLNTLALADESVFVVNPTTIRDQLLSKNMSLMQALNNIENSKLNVSLARAKLLPSLDLGVLLPSIVNPSFLLSSITFLFPFLVPSNWLIFKREKALFESDKASYLSLELNILSNALSLYYTFLNDQKIQKIFQDQSLKLNEIYKNLKKQSDILGNVSNDELAMASAQYQESKIRASVLQELLIAENASLRTLLALPLGSKLMIEDIPLMSSDFEQKTAAELAERSIQVAPEMNQLSFLIKAAKADKFAKVFGFISFASISGINAISNSPFDDLKIGGGFRFGVDNLINIEIGNNHIEYLHLRVDQFKEENQKIAEILVGQIQEVKEQQKFSHQALLDRTKVYEAQKRQYALGLLPLQTLLQTEVHLTDSYILNTKADLDLKMQRLTLLRLVIDGDFLKVKGCSPAAHIEKKSFFKRDKGQSLDELCRQ